jgi:propanol-preferring alcohol dehydrogenase
MRAAVVTDFTAPLQVLDLPVPEPGPGQVLVRIECTGCATPTSTPHAVTGR